MTVQGVLDEVEPTRQPASPTRRRAASVVTQAGRASGRWLLPSPWVYDEHIGAPQQRADAQLPANDVNMQELKDQLMALAQPPAPTPSPAAAPGSVTDRLGKLYDDD